MIDTAIWLVIFVVCLLIESQTVELLALWFSVGALVAMIASLCGAELWLQITLFLVISGVLLAALRPLVKKFIKPKITATNVDAVIGSQGYLTSDVDNLAATGEVKLGALIWSARSSDGEKLPAGTLVKVDRIEGVKVFVSPVREEEKV
jgi:membrane protein implicated in regulation of membrane protease activity